MFLIFKRTTEKLEERVHIVIEIEHQFERRVGKPIILEIFLC